MKFPKALKILQNGGSVCREEWGSGYRVLIYGGCLCTRDVAGHIRSWLITSDAILADDWTEE